MGLDVYLYKCPDRAAADEAEKLHEEFSELAWNAHEKYEDFTEAEKEEARQKCDEYDRMIGIVDYRHISREKIEIDSAKYPEHYFKVGYFRSSYNESGFNSLMQTLGFPTLYDLFEVVDRETDGVHDWQKCRENVAKALNDFSNYVTSGMGRFSVMSIRDGIDKVGSEHEALETFKENFLDKRNDDFRDFSGRQGQFHLDGIKCFAFIPGKTRWGECMYVVYEHDGLSWYLQALEIVLETIDFILAQPDKEQYYLVWSG